MNFLIEHVYFLNSLIFLAYWVVLFWIHNAKERRQMLIVSLITMVLGQFLEQMHFTDWWRPHFISDSFIHIEDVFFGFGVGGMISGVYALVRSHMRDTRAMPFTFSQKAIFTTASLFAVFGLFYLFGVHSFIASIIALCVPVGIATWRNTQSLPAIFATGIIMTVFAFCGYQFTLYIDPQFVQTTYLLEHLSGVFVHGVPIEELLWFFFAGAGIAAFRKITE